jgi:hypothetical protein
MTAPPKRPPTVRTVAALYVDPAGIYSTMPGVDPWGEERDARTYAGPHPVVAHPPCARWGRYWHGGPSVRERRRLGDDDGCFDAALRSVLDHGGVLEHPEATHAWRHANIVAPPRGGGWVPAGLFHAGAWTCCVEQGHYGHRARKATWLLLVGAEPPELAWGPSVSKLKIDDGYHTQAERMGKRERAATPRAFAEVLVAMARSARAGAGLQPDHVLREALETLTQ